MPSNDIDALREELQAAVDVITPQIRGLEDLSKVSLSPATLAIVNSEKSDHGRRLGLLNDVLKILANLVKAIEALVEDGYPVVPTATVEAAVFSELQEQLRDLEAAFAKFLPAEVAAKMTVSLGVAQPKQR